MILIDVRTPEEFSNGHVDGAENIPVEQMVSGTMPHHDKNEEYTVYCRSGARAEKAIGLMKQHGFHNVTNAGGMS